MPGPAYMKLEGKNMGEIKGDVDISGDDKKDHIEVQAIEHTVTRPYNNQDGEPEALPTHHPYKVTKVIDKASPLLMQALNDNEEMKYVEVKWFDPANAKYFVTRMENAHIVSIRTYKPNALNGNAGGTPDMEEVSFTYSKIKLDHQVASTSAEIDWKAK